MNDRADWMGAEEAKPQSQPSRGEIKRVLLDYYPNTLHLGVAQAITALFAAFPDDIFIYDKQLVQVDRVPRAGRPGLFTPGVRPLTVDALRPMLTEAIDFQRYDGRAKDFVAAGVPKELAAAILAVPAATPAKALAGITALPLIRSNGLIRTKPGFDTETGAFLFEPPPMPPAQPERRQKQRSTGSTARSSPASRSPTSHPAQSRSRVSLPWSFDRRSRVRCQGISPPPPKAALARATGASWSSSSPLENWLFRSPPTSSRRRPKSASSPSC
jgi:hypothetical protein